MRAIRAFGTDESGLTALECAAILAVLIPLTFAFAEIQRYNRFARHMWAAADGLASLVAARTERLAGAALTQDAGAVADIFAEAAAPLGARWREGIGVQATLVRFIADPRDCVTACSYPLGSIVWTWSGGTDGSRALLQRAGVLRSCGTLVPSASRAVGAEILVGEAFGPDMRIVVDLVFPFRPMLVSNILGPHLMTWQGHARAAADLGDTSGLSDEVAACS